MPSFQQVIVVGHLGGDPEVRYTKNGDPVANFSVATTEKWKDKTNGELHEETEWHRVSVFGQSAENYVGKYLRKGDAVFVRGQLKTRKWQDRDGNDRYTTEIRADRFGGIQGLSGRKSDSDGKGYHGKDNVSQTPQNGAPSVSGNNSPKDFDNDIPF